MTDVAVLQIAQNALTVALQLCAPILSVSLTVGLGVSVFQAATQIQEQTLSFVPKLLALSAALILFGPWMLRVMMTYTTNLLTDLPKFVR